MALDLAKKTKSLKLKTHRYSWLSQRLSTVECAGRECDKYLRLRFVRARRAEKGGIYVLQFCALITTGDITHLECEKKQGQT